MQKEIYTILIIIFFAVSCKSNTSTSSSPVHEDGMVEIGEQWVTKISCQEMLPLPQIDSCTFIILETNERCLLDLTSRSKIRYCDDKYFICDMQGVFVFDQQGHFLNTIGSKGHGPKEYYMITTFYINEDKKHVVILDGYKGKGLNYDFEGKFIEEFQIDETIFSSRSFAAIKNVRYMGNGKIICHYAVNSQSNLGATISNEDFSDLIVLYENDLVYEGFFSWFNNTSIKNKNEMLYTKIFCDTIYSYSLDENKINTPYLISAIKSVPDGFKREGQDANELSLKLIRSGHSAIVNILSTDKYFLITTLMGGNILWDINEQKGYHERCSHYYVNDKCGFSMWVVEADGNNFIGTISAEQILNTDDENVINSPKFKAMRNKTTEEDNGAIVIYHMK